MSEENQVSIYEYQPEHFGDTIFEGVIVREIHTTVVDRGSVPAGIIWSWRYDHKFEQFLGPFNDSQHRVVGTRSPPTRDEVMADIAELTRRLLAEGSLRKDAFEAA